MKIPCRASVVSYFRRFLFRIAESGELAVVRLLAAIHISIGLSSIRARGGNIVLVAE